MSKKRILKKMKMKGFYYEYLDKKYLDNNKNRDDCYYLVSW